MLDEHIETLRARVSETSEREQSLMRDLGQAMSLAEENLLRHVREIAAEHGARRERVLGELRELALRMGALPAHHQQPVYPAQEIPPLDLTDVANGGGSPAIGDWRRAASFIEDDEGVVQLLHASGR